MPKVLVFLCHPPPGWSRSDPWMMPCDPWVTPGDPWWPRGTLGDWLTDWLTYIPIGRLTDWLVDGWSNWLTDTRWGAVDLWSCFWFGCRKWPKNGLHPLECKNNAWKYIMWVVYNFVSRCFMTHSNDIWLEFTWVKFSWVNLTLLELTWVKFSWLEFSLVCMSWVDLSSIGFP